MTPEWASLIKDVGFPVALAVALTIFLLKGVWPWATKQTEIAQAQATKAIEALSGLRENLIQQTEINRQVVDVLRDIKRGRDERN